MGDTCRNRRCPDSETAQGLIFPRVPVATPRLGEGNDGRSAPLGLRTGRAALEWRCPTRQLVSVLARSEGPAPQGPPVRISGLDACRRLCRVRGHLPVRRHSRSCPALAHVRRKFVDVHRAQGSAIADEAIRRIAQFYAIETEAGALRRTGVSRSGRRRGHRSSMVSRPGCMLNCQRSRASHRWPWRSATP